MSFRQPKDEVLSRARSPEDKHKVREALIAAGRKLFTENPPSSVSLRRIAAEAGYAQPILHGMATLGVACHGLLTTLGLAPEALQRLDARFTAPVFPGEALETRVWRDAERCRFELWQPERAIVVLRGTAQARSSAR